HTFLYFPAIYLCAPNLMVGGVHLILRLSHWHNSIFKSTLKSAYIEKNIRTGEIWLFPTSP
ncbi:hypothetical protein, partial [Escherichia coli]|uniref:hypothetical protein n=1 Tax=Escherichia coli TaxID=562 RepID=UPI001A7E05B5